MPVRLLAAVMTQESGGDPGAVSSAGAQGLFQFMPGTAHGYGISDPFDPLQSALGGGLYLRDLYRQFGRWDLALAAYNAGPGAVEEAGNRVPNNTETRAYVASIMGMLGEAP